MSRSGAGPDPHRAEARYPLALEFLWSRGAKETEVTAAQRSIRNAAGRQSLRAPSGGPMVLLSLADGDYTVTARSEGTTRSRVV